MTSSDVINKLVCFHQSYLAVHFNANVNITFFCFFALPCGIKEYTISLNVLCPGCVEQVCTSLGGGAQFFLVAFDCSATRYKRVVVPGTSAWLCRYGLQ